MGNSGYDVGEFQFWTREWLACSCCGDKFRFPLEGDSVYLYSKPDFVQGTVWLKKLIQDVRDGQAAQQKNFWHIPYKRIWCQVCNTASLAERLPTTRELFAAAEALRSSYSDLQDQLLDYSLSDLYCLAEGLQQRSDAGHCLQCGSTDYVTVQVGSDGVVSSLVHEPCLNSALKWHGVVSSSNFRFPGYARVLSFDGQLLWHGSLQI